MRIVFHYVLPAHDDRSFVVKFPKGCRKIKRKTEEKSRTPPSYFIVRDVKCRSFENRDSYSYFYAIN